MNMNKSEILKKLNGIFCKVFSQSDININYHTTADDLEEWDSITNLLLIDTIEKEFGFKFTLNEIMNSEKIEDWCDIILANIQ